MREPPSIKFANLQIRMIFLDATKQEIEFTSADDGSIRTGIDAREMYYVPVQWRDA